MKPSSFLLAAVVLFAGGVTAGEAAPPAPAPAAPAAPAPAPAPTATAPTTTTAAPAATGATADEEYGLKMKELEDSVAELKEQIFRSKAKLTLLTEQVQGGTGAGARIVLTHKNQLGGNFLITQVNYFLDGTPLWQQVDETGAKLTPMKDHPLWDGNIIEGSHTLSVEIRIQGDGTGVFQYLKGYKFTMKEPLSFTAEPGKLMTIDVVLYEKGNFTTEMTERPALRFDQSVKTDTAKKKATKK